MILANLLDSLRAGRTKEECQASLREVQKLLRQEPAPVEHHVRRELQRELLNALPELTRESQGDYWTMDLLTYQASPRRWAMAVLVAFVQDHRDAQEGLDQLVAQRLWDRLKSQGLHAFVKDVSVNGVQVPAA